MEKSRTPGILIGIDPGVDTGLAVYDEGECRIKELHTFMIHQAMEAVITLYRLAKIGDQPFLVVVEDARLRKWFGKTGREKLQGAGSVKRDSKIWADFLKDKGVPFRMVPPKGGATKVDASLFAKMTGYTGRSSEHSRDAAMKVFGGRIKDF